MTMIISIVQQKGGSGKTTISTNLAVYLSILGKKIGFVDLDPQQSATMWYKLRQENNGDNTIDLLLHNYDIQEVLSAHKSNYDFIIIDTPPHSYETAKPLVVLSDFVIIPTQLSPMDIWASQTILDLVQLLKKPHFMVLNRVPFASRVAYNLKQALVENNLPIAQTPIGNRNSYVAAFIAGSGVTEAEDKSRASTEIKELTQELLLKIFNIQNTEKVANILQT